MHWLIIYFVGFAGSQAVGASSFWGIKTESCVCRSSQQWRFSAAQTKPSKNLYSHTLRSHLEAHSCHFPNHQHFSGNYLIYSFHLSLLKNTTLVLINLWIECIFVNVLVARMVPQITERWSGGCLEENQRENDAACILPYQRWPFPFGPTCKPQILYLLQRTPSGNSY